MKKYRSSIYFILHMNSELWAREYSQKSHTLINIGEVTVNELMNAHEFCDEWRQRWRWRTRVGAKYFLFWLYVYLCTYVYTIKCNTHSHTWINLTSFTRQI